MVWSAVPSFFGKATVNHRLLSLFEQFFLRSRCFLKDEEYSHRESIVGPDTLR